MLIWSLAKQVVYKLALDHSPTLNTRTVVRSKHLQPHSRAGVTLSRQSVSYFTTSALIVNGLSLLKYLWQPITGPQYPTYTWQAEILWAGATWCREHLSESPSLLPLDDLGPVKRVGRQGEHAAWLLTGAINGFL